MLRSPSRSRPGRGGARSASRSAVSRPAVYRLYGEAADASAPERLHVEDIESRARLYNWSITPHAHNDIWQVIYIDRGSAVADVEGETTRLADRNAIIIPAGVVHGFDFRPDTAGWVLSIESRLFETPGFAQARSVFQHHQFSVSTVTLTAARNRDARFLFGRLSDEFRNTRAGRGPVLESLTIVLLILLLRDAPPDGDEARQGQRGQRLLAEFRNLINVHYREHWPVAAYAEALQVSQSQLFRVARALAGQSPSELINARLLLEAQRNLHYTEASAAQIALDLGFHDPAYFSRFFRRLAGVSPSEYREQAQTIA